MTNLNEMCLNLHKIGETTFQFSNFEQFIWESFLHKIARRDAKLIEERVYIDSINRKIQAGSSKFK